MKYLFLVLAALLPLSSLAQNYEPRITASSLGAISTTAIDTSAELKAIVGDSLGNASGKLLFAQGRIDITSGKTVTFSNTLTVAGIDGSTLNIGTGGTLGAGAFLPAPGYVLSLRAFNQANAVIADSTTYYAGNFGNPVWTLSGTWANSRVYVPRTGVIKTISVHLYIGTSNGTSEAVSYSLRLNDTTDTALTASATWDVAASDLNFTGLSIPVTAGDYIALKIVTPAWVTNPVGASIMATVYIE